MNPTSGAPTEAPRGVDGYTRGGLELPKYVQDFNPGNGFSDGVLSTLWLVRLRQTDLIRFNAVYRNSSNGPGQSS